MGKEEEEEEADDDDESSCRSSLYNVVDIDAARLIG
jgi:hypothetical protein